MTATSSSGSDDARRERLVDLCAALVACDSAQPKGRTQEAVAVLELHLRDAGLAPRRVLRTGGKPNLVCTFQGAAGPGIHLVLNGHLDTLDPGDPAAWAHPPLTMARHAGRLSGLGIGNMKAGAAALTLAFIALFEARAALHGRVTLTLVADEVVFGPDGAAHLLATEPDLCGDALICAEGPGERGLAIAEKGLLWLAVETTAPPRQGMTVRRAETATARLAAMLGEIDALNDETIAPPDGFESLAANAGAHAQRLSVNIGTIAAGHFVSQVATHARAEIDCRVPLGMSIEALESRINDIVSRHGPGTLNRIKGWDASATRPDAGLVRALSDAARAIHGTAPKLVSRLPASDAQRWRARAIPAVCYGPQPEFASGINDYVIEDDALACVAIYERAARDLLAGGQGGLT